MAKTPSHPPKLKRVIQCQIDPLRQLPRPLRRRACEILNDLRQPSLEPLLVPIAEASVVAIALNAAFTQGLITLRDVVFEPP